MPGLYVVQALGLGQGGKRQEEAAHQNIMVPSSKCCDVCATNILAEYDSGYRENAFYCLEKYEDAIKRKDNKNDTAKLLDIYHPDDVEDPQSCLSHQRVSTLPSLYLLIETSSLLG